MSNRMARIVNFGVILLRRLSLWQSVAVGIVLVAVWDGSGYAAKGNAYSPGSSSIFLRNSVPGGMHTHGVIMLLLAGGILYSMHDRPRMAYRVMTAVFMYSISLQCAIFYGWYLSKQISWSAPSKWFFIAWAALALMVKIEEMNKHHPVEQRRIEPS